MAWWDTVIGAFRGTKGEAPPAPVAPSPAPPLPIFSKEVLRAIGVDEVRAERLHFPLSVSARRFEINTPLRASMFLAQVAHESGLFRYSREIWGPTEAQRRYEGRVDLGNTEPGDGFRFRGRGFIQITGRANTLEAKRALGWVQDVDSFCAWLETPEGASESAAWFWATHGCNELADAGNFAGVTRRINGGMNGHRERFALWTKAQSAMA